MNVGQKFHSARKDSQLAVLEGIHTLKHALRFNAKVLKVIVWNKEKVLKLSQDLAPDAAEYIAKTAEVVDKSTFKSLSPNPPRTGIISIAKRKQWTIDDINPDKLVVWLEKPSDPENIGAVIRVGASAGAGGVIVTGETDLWQPASIRGSAGLHFALPVLQAEFSPQDLGRQIAVFTPSGSKLTQASGIKQNAVMIFGNERFGVDKQTMNLANVSVSLPMEPGVSSLNLATSVAAALYSLKLS